MRVMCAPQPAEAGAPAKPPARVQPETQLLWKLAETMGGSLIDDVTDVAVLPDSAGANVVPPKPPRTRKLPLRVHVIPSEVVMPSAAVFVEEEAAPRQPAKKRSTSSDGM